MLRSFLIITFRVLWRNKVTSFVNISSLSIGIAAFIFIMLYVQHEISYDRFHTKYNRIYRLEGDDYAKLPPVIGSYVRDRLPEVQNIARLAGGMKANNIISYFPENNPQDLKQIETNFFWADSTTFHVFSFPFILGDPHTALKEPMTAVLTESTARKLFGDTNPMLKTIEFRDHQYMVTGIMRDIRNSHIEIDIMFSMASIAKVFPDRDLNNTGPNSWLWSATYLLMTDKIDERIVEDKVNRVLSEINDGTLFDIEFKYFSIRPLKDIYFEGALRHLPYGVHGNLKLIQILVAVGVFMLVLAGINYVNLTTARSFIRVKEIAVKRMSGCSAKLLRYQLVIESIIVSIISLVVAVTMMQLLLPRFNNLAMIDIHVEDLNSPNIWTLIFAAAVIIGIVAGLYPAFYLTAIQPVRLIKGGRSSGSRGSLFRSGLMTFQFALSIIMIVAIIVNLRQMQYIRNADLGFNKEHIIRIITPADIPEMYELRQTFKERLLQHYSITKVGFSAGVPGGDVPMAVFELDGVKRVSGFFPIDEDYLDVMQIEMSEGRAFSLDRPGDKAGPDHVSILFNESAVREFDIASPVGKKFTLDNGTKVEIIGIVKDFHYWSLHDKIEPMYFIWAPPMHTVSIKIASANIPATLRIIKAEWKSVWGSRLFNYQFVDEIYDLQYKSDEQLTTVIGYFTGLAVIIACLGLFALSSFMVSRRTKEIGVRKTLGASTGAIYFMLSWNFLKWILVAVVIGVPVAWYLMHLWLETFAYHINIGLDIFIIATLLTVGIALLTVTGQSLIAANSNPVKALRYE